MVLGVLHPAAADPPLCCAPFEVVGTNNQDRIETLEAGFGIALDGRALRTPAKTVVTLPSAALAKAVADEWAVTGMFELSAILKVSSIFTPCFMPSLLISVKIILRSGKFFIVSKKSKHEICV